MIGRPRSAPRTPATPRRAAVAFAMRIVSMTLAFGVVTGCGGGGSDAAPAFPEIDLTGAEPRVAEAIREAREAAVADPDDVEGIGRLAGTLHAHGFVAPAEAAYARARSIDPTDFRWAYLLAIVRERAGADAIACERAFVDALALRSDYAPAFVRTGRALAKRGRHHSAADAFVRATELEPRSAAGFRGLGQSLLAIDEPVRALPPLRTATALAPGDAGAWNALALALRRTGKPEEAAAAAERAVRLRPAAGFDDPVFRRAVTNYGVSARHEMARALEAGGRGDYHRAAEHLAHVVAARPDDARAHVLLGVSEARRGRGEAAAAALTRALELEPDDPRAAAELERVRRGEIVSTRGAAGSPDEFGSRPAVGGDRIDEFHAIARRLLDGDNEILGSARRHALQRTIDAGGLDLQAEVSARASLTLELLELGEVPDAVRQVELALEAVRDLPMRPAIANLHRLRGIAYLRAAEVANCVERHDAECCIFPLRGGGIHEVREPAQEARRAFETVLEVLPGDLTSQWLLNVTAMALADWPDGVAPAHRLPAEAFRSEIDLGRFVDRAPELGLATFSLCGGAVADDFDGDGRYDLVASTSHPEQSLGYYRADGRGGFEDRSRASRATDQLGGLNVVAADYDNDGDPDLLVLRGAWLFDDGKIRNSLLRNDDGVFIDVTHAAGLAEPAYPTQAAAWLDYDNDGDLDVYVGNESRLEASGGREGDFPSQLFRNDGDGTFVDVAKAAGVANDRYTKGVAVGDYDDDGDVDLYVSNVGANRLYRNDGDGTFTDVAARAGVAEPSDRSFATWFFDYDHDGDLDLFVAGYRASVSDLVREATGAPHDAERPRLYRNDGDGTFTDVAKSSGLDRPFLPMGANFGDVDNDGFLDIYLATGDPSYQSLMPNVLLVNDGGRRFLDAGEATGLGHLQKGHGVAFADLDGDGDQDLFHQLGGFYPGDAFANALFENPGHGNAWIAIELEGVRSNRSGFGARLRLTVSGPSGKRDLYRAVGSVSSFGGSPRRQEIGLGDAASIDAIEVWWPASDVRQRFERVDPNRVVRIREDRAWIEELDVPRVRLGGG